MSHPARVVIVVARCRFTLNAFGIRFEPKSPPRWTATWAFPLKETSAQREGYNRNRIIGSFDFDQEYPGCPHCKASSIFQCYCGKINCWEGSQTMVTCGWCGQEVILTDTIRQMDAGTDV
jgi:hypothetical protein